MKKQKTKNKKIKKELNGVQRRIEKEERQKERKVEKKKKRKKKGEWPVGERRKVTWQD